MIGAGSFGTALAVLLARGGLRVTLQARTAEQAERLADQQENRDYLPEVKLPAQLRIEPLSSGVELAGAAKNAAALAAGATEAQGLNAAGAAAGHIFAEVWRYAQQLGARPESMIGLAGVGDLVATALARESRNRRAGELLAAGVSAPEIAPRIGQAVESLQSVPLLAQALEEAGVQAPVTSALGRLISGELPLEDWVALVRAAVPPPARWRRRPGLLSSMRASVLTRLRRGRGRA